MATSEGDPFPLTPGYTRIRLLDSEVDAQLVDAELAERGIPHLVRSYRDSALDGLFQVQRGWGVLDGPADRAEEIEQICTDVLATDTAPTEALEPEVASLTSVLRWIPLAMWAVVVGWAAGTGRLVLFSQVGLILLLGLVALFYARSRSHSE